MEEFYTVKQAAIILKVHHLTVRRYITENKLKAYRIGGNIRISANDLRAFTQNFIPHTRQHEPQASNQTKPFSLSDPVLQLRGRGINISRLEETDI